MAKRKTFSLEVVPETVVSALQAIIWRWRIKSFTTCYGSNRERTSEDGTRHKLYCLANSTACRDTMHLSWNPWSSWMIATRLLTPKHFLGIARLQSRCFEKHTILLEMDYRISRISETSEQSYRETRPLSLSHTVNLSGKLSPYIILHSWIKYVYYYLQHWYPFLFQNKETKSSL